MKSFGFFVLGMLTVVALVTHHWYDMNYINPDSFTVAKNSHDKSVTIVIGHANIPEYDTNYSIMCKGGVSKDKYLMVITVVDEDAYNEFVCQVTTFMEQKNHGYKKRVKQ